MAIAVKVLSKEPPPKRRILLSCLADRYVADVGTLPSRQAPTMVGYAGLHLFPHHSLVIVEGSLFASMPYITLVSQARLGPGWCQTPASRRTLALPAVRAVLPSRVPPRPTHYQLRQKAPAQATTTVDGPSPNSPPL